jgi:hypothetical protein
MDGPGREYERLLIGHFFGGPHDFRLKSTYLGRLRRKYFGKIIFSQMCHKQLKIIQDIFFTTLKLSAINWMDKVILSGPFATIYRNN